MATIKLTYFDVDGGRGEPIRLILSWAGIDFEDNRFPFSEFAEVRKKTPFKQVPIVEMDGAVITQTNALCRYFGKLAGLYPDNDMAALLCDEAMDVIEDITAKFVATFSLKGDDLKQSRETLADGPLKHVLSWLEQRVTDSNSGWLAGGEVTIADLKVWVFVRSLLSGQFDHISPTLVFELAPKVVEHCNKVAALPKLVEYYSKRKLSENS
ncbi:MAG: glutathione S-transferase family protein [Gammaproteobacteria bacterium]|nr:glutathione S-transferase family protein [Gammaproteobacteria bacterium]